MKKPDYFNKVVSEQLGISLKIVKEVNAYYWRNGVKRNLSEVNYNGIYIKNFGTIVVSRYKLNKEIGLTITKIRRIIKSEKLFPVKKQFILDVYYKNLRKLLERRNEIAIDYYQKKKIYGPRRRISKANTQGTPECGENIGGSSESCENEIR